MWNPNVENELEFDEISSTKNFLWNKLYNFQIHNIISSLGFAKSNTVSPLIPIRV